MKKLLVFLCVVFMILGAVGCKSDSNSGNVPVTSLTTQTDGAVDVGAGSHATPEPATILLIGSGLVGLAAVGRKKFFNKDQD